MTVVAISNQKGRVGKTTTAANPGVLLARLGRRVLVVDADPQFELTRQLGVEERSLGVNPVDVLAGRAAAADAIARDVHGVDVIAVAPPLAGAARATGCEIEARPHRLGYQLILDQNAVDRLAELLQPAAGADQ